jgi:hypothetical protein
MSVSDIADSPLLVEQAAAKKSVRACGEELFALTTSCPRYALFEKPALQGERQGAGFFVRGRSLARRVPVAPAHRLDESALIAEGSRLSARPAFRR